LIIGVGNGSDFFCGKFSIEEFYHLAGKNYHSVFYFFKILRLEISLLQQLKTITT